jgi:hypothetical protein
MRAIYVRKHLYPLNSIYPNQHLISSPEDLVILNAVKELFVLNPEILRYAQDDNKRPI